MQISINANRCEPSPMRKFHPYAVEAEKKGKKIYHLNIGQPDLPTPTAYYDAVRNFDRKTLAYAESPGMPVLIDAVRGYYHKLGVDLAPNDVLITTGGSEALLTGILRDEWGFDGAVITDYCDHHSYMNGDQALRAGGSLWMAGFTGGEMAFETGSNSYLQALRRATKEALYMYLHVRVTNRDYADSIGDTTAVRHAFTTSVFGWRHLVALIDIVAVVLFTLAVRGVVIDVRLRKAAKTEKKNF